MQTVTSLALPMSFAISTRILRTAHGRSRVATAVARLRIIRAYQSAVGTGDGTFSR